MTRWPAPGTERPEVIRARYMALSPGNPLRVAFERGRDAIRLDARNPYDGRTVEARAWLHGREVVGAVRRLEERTGA